MGLKGRIGRLEGRRRPEGCPECAGRIAVGTEQDDGSVAWWEGQAPCETCGGTRVIVRYDEDEEEVGGGGRETWD